MAAGLKEAELGTPVTDLIRKVRASEQTLYRRQKDYGAFETSRARKLRQIEEGNDLPRDLRPIHNWGTALCWVES